MPCYEVLRGFIYSYEGFDSDKVEKLVSSSMGFVDAPCKAHMLLMAGLFATLC